MSDLDALRSEITAVRDEARIALDLALTALAQCNEPLDGAWDEHRETVLRDVAGKLLDLLVQEELLADMESVAMSMIYDVEPSLQHLARGRGKSDDGGSTPQT
jgi:hypothetical protein